MKRTNKFELWVPRWDSDTYDVIRTNRLRAALARLLKDNGVIAVFIHYGYYSVVLHKSKISRALQRVPYDGEKLFNRLWFLTYTHKL